MDVVWVNIVAHTWLEKNPLYMNLGCKEFGSDNCNCIGVPMASLVKLLHVAIVEANYVLVPFHG